MCNIKIFTLQIEGMLSKWSWIVFNLIVCVSTTPKGKTHAETEAFLKLIEMDYEDTCSTTANAQWSFIVSPSNETLLAWVDTSLKLNPLQIKSWFVINENTSRYFLERATI